MSVTLANFQETIPAAYIKEGKKLVAKKAVRELEEGEKGHFTAFADDGPGSFDVSLFFDISGALVQHNCDCKSTYAFCKHKVAVLLQLKETGREEKKKKSAAKKISPAEALLQTLDFNQLQAWLLTILQKHKDLELSFLNHFSVTSSEMPKPEDIKKRMDDAVKAVLKTRRKAEQAELKKIVDLWKDITQPVMDRCCSNISNPASVELIYTMQECVSFYHYELKYTGSKIMQFKTALLEQVKAALTVPQKTTDWEAAVTAFCSLVTRHDTRLLAEYVKMLVELGGKANREQQEYIAAALAIPAATPKWKKSSNYDEAAGIMLPFFINTQQFEKYSHLFSPVRYQNEYNIMLIDALTGSGHYTAAAGFCNDQIKGNYKEEYNIPYWQALKRIYELQNDNKKLVEILQLLLPYTFNIEDYNKIFSSMPPSEERNKWRTKIFTRARKFSNHKQAMDFCFQLLKQEEKYKKMLDLVDRYTPFAVYIRYFNELYAGDKNELLKRLFEKEQSWHSDDDSKGPLLDETAALVKKHYTETAIRAFAGKEERWSYYRAPLKEYFRKLYNIKSDGKPF
jgi:uncharacterized protein YozE (UPF0346 family)